MHIAIKTNEKSTKNKYFFKKISVVVMEFNFTVPSILKSFIFSFTNIVQTKPRMCFLQPNCGTRFNQIFGTLCLLSSLEQKRGSVKKHRGSLKNIKFKSGVHNKPGDKNYLLGKVHLSRDPQNTNASYSIYYFCATLGADKTFSRFTPANFDEIF